MAAKPFKVSPPLRTALRKLALRTKLLAECPELAKQGLNRQWKYKKDFRIFQAVLTPTMQGVTVKKDRRLLEVEVKFIGYRVQGKYAPSMVCSVHWSPNPKFTFLEHFTNRFFWSWEIDRTRLKMYYRYQGGPVSEYYRGGNVAMALVKLSERYMDYFGPNPPKKKKKRSKAHDNAKRRATEQTAGWFDVARNAGASGAAGITGFAAGETKDPQS